MQVHKTLAEIEAHNVANAEYIAVGLVEKWEAIPTPAPRTTPKQLNHKWERYSGWAVLPIGLVNLVTAKNAMFGTMWDCWEESEKGTNYALQSADGKSFKVIHSSGSHDIIVGDTTYLKHDQTGSRIGDLWKVVAVAPHTKAGLLALKSAVGKSSLAFATFK